MRTVDSQLVPAILLVMTGPIVMFLLWVLCSLHREIERSRASRAHTLRRTRARLARFS